jgi:arylsulfatase A
MVRLLIRWPVLMAAALLFAVLPGTLDAEPAGRPNIVLIMADDFGYECLGCNGSVSYRTPVLDGLAATGVRFTHCFSQPLCTPSRVQIMTGKHNFRNYRAFGWLDPRETTFGQLLKRAGYRTCIAGKWQLNGLTYQLPGYDDNGRPRHFGFDEYCLWQLTQPKSQGERYADPLVEFRGEEPVVREGEYGPDVFLEFVTEFIEQNQTEPFFVYYPMVLTHDPFVPTPDSPAWRGNRNKKGKQFFADMVAYTDQCVGRIVAKLDELGLRENTLILFTGDNGSPRQITSETASGTIAGGKGLTLDSGCHVPLVANWKGVARGGVVCNDLIEFTDFLPTLLDAARTKPPADLILDGRSFLPQLRGEPGQPRDWVFCHYDPVWGTFEPDRFARDHRHKLYRDGRLFDVQSDPRETAPLPDDAEPAVRQKLQSALDSFPPWEPLQKRSPNR